MHLSLSFMRLHLLTSSRPHRLRMEMQQESDGLWYWAEYFTFQIGDEATGKYRLNVDGYSGDAGDSLQATGSGDFTHDGMKFSTYNNDNDLGTTNCASDKHGGWWLNRCYKICLMCTGKHKSYTLPARYLVDSRMMIKVNP